MMVFWNLMLVLRYEICSQRSNVYIVRFYQETQEILFDFWFRVTPLNISDFKSGPVKRIFARHLFRASAEA